jgi:hypothetical protein
METLARVGLDLKRDRAIIFTQNSPKRGVKRINHSDPGAESCPTQVPDYFNIAPYKVFDVLHGTFFI